jgi:hypothetical protein
MAISLEDGTPILLEDQTELWLESDTEDENPTPTDETPWYYYAQEE